MDSNGLRFVIKNFTDITPGEFEQLQKASSNYPYSQILHVLESRASKDLKTDNHISLLHKTAVYATDRAVVKWALTAPRKERMEPVMVTQESKPPVRTPGVAVKAKAPEPAREVASIKSAPKQVEPHLPENPLHGDALRSDLAFELNKLQQLKRDFEASYQNFKNAFHFNEPFKDIRTPRMDLHSPAEPSLIEEIKTSRKKLKVASPKAIEQNEIIDQFIKAAPAIPKAKPELPKADLAETSSHFSDNIVSETLVTILIKQGKKVKAIEMLKKLIWKFPQKKAYFAAQIEELKK